PVGRMAQGCTGSSWSARGPKRVPGPMSRGTVVLRHPEIVGDPCVAHEVEVGDKICDSTGIVQLVVRIEKSGEDLAFFSDNEEHEWLPVHRDTMLAVVRR
ncbi:MAG: hypothetical protein ACRD1T_12550, partial [Acidimicrobiia bacterium]